jgi:hypothetical protein
MSKALLASLLGTTILRQQADAATGAASAEGTAAVVAGAGANGAEQPASAASVDPAAALNTEFEHPIVINKEASFHFKKDELGVKRPTIKLTYPVPTLEGVVRALKDEKQREYILDILAEQVKIAVRAQINDNDENKNFGQNDLDISKLTIEALANLPKAERTGGGISKETWEQWAKDYMEVMPAVAGRNAEQIGNAVKLLLAKFQPVKTQKPVINFLKEQLSLWATSTQRLEEFVECYDFLIQKADTLLSKDEAELLANL